MRRRRLPFFDNDQNFPFCQIWGQTADLASIPALPFEICLLQKPTHTRLQLPSMTTGQFSGLLSILYGSLALIFFWFFVCNADHLLSWALKAVLLLYNLYLQSRKWPTDNFQKSQKVFVSQDLKAIGWPGSGASNHSYHTTLRPRISISHVVQLLQRRK